MFRNLDDSVYNLSSYQTEFCQMDAPPPLGRCIPPRSLVRYFDGTYRNISAIFYDPDFRNVPAVLYEASTRPETAADFRFFLAKGYRITPTESYSNLTRSSLPVGWPLDGTGTDDENLAKVDAFLQKDVKPALESVQFHGGLKMNYFSSLLFSYDVQRQVGVRSDVCRSSYFSATIVCCILVKIH